MEIKCIEVPDMSAWQHSLMGATLNTSFILPVVGETYTIRALASVTATFAAPYHKGVILKEIQNKRAYAGMYDIGEVYFPLVCFVRKV
jgi:hypothetical protein